MSNRCATDSMPDKQSESTDIRPESPAVVQVALPVPVRKLFDYRLPAGLPLPRPGCRVKVGFGSRIMTGMVINVCDSSSLDLDKLKAVSEIVDSEPLLDSRHIDLLGWVADYYLHPAGEVYFSALPNSCVREKR